MGWARLRRFLANRNANVAMIFGLTLLPMLLSVGAGMDYSLAAMRQQQLNAAADAAVLAAITPANISQGDSASIQTAQDAFNAQAAPIKGILYSTKQVTATATDSATTRTVTVTYTAASENAFMTILGIPTIQLAGKAQASAQSAPNIDFYLLLDSSPSMAIAATQSGIDTMVSNTPSQGGCAFGCHQFNASADNLGNPGGVDNYALARTLGVTLRIDLLRQAAQNLMTTAASTEVTTKAKYQMGIYTFDASFNTIQNLTPDLALAAADAANIQMLEVYKNNWLTSAKNNSDADTNYDFAMTSVNATMPTPGNGSNTLGDTPQEVLFFVTDGVEDELVSGSRKQSLMNPNWCTTIKNRGIRIAVLYTSYLPLPTNAWYNTYISPFQPNISPTLESCASPGLFYQVSTGGDISSALAALFQTAVQTAHLTL